MGTNAAYVEPAESVSKWHGTSPKSGETGAVKIFFVLEGLRLLLRSGLSCHARSFAPGLDFWTDGSFCIILVYVFLANGWVVYINRLFLMAWHGMACKGTSKPRPEELKL
ncbi:unnamed protein product [Ilex paraguariensis]|uniref:Uncharacterized protein n=1 Tax=Ilex paraguariensis TaxID=185542 RepID=A0ABC8RYT4_9AQUA